MSSRWIALAVAAVSWSAPHVAAAVCTIRAPAMVPEPHCPPPDPPNGPVDKRFLAYPYAKGHVGYIVESPRDDRYREGRDIAGQLAIEGGALPGPRARGRAALRASYNFLSVDTSWNLVGNLVDESDLVFSETNATLDRRGKHLVARFGGGFRLASLGPLRAHQRPWSAGWNLTASADAFPIRPLVVSAQVDVGRLGGEWATHARATAGAVVRGVELYVGFDGYVQGHTALGGPVLGLRMWI